MYVISRIPRRLNQSSRVNSTGISKGYFPHIDGYLALSPLSSVDVYRRS